MRITSIAISGAIIAVIAVALQLLGNPGNMGMCVACMIRDITGALGLHRAAVVQYLRPEIMGFVLGATISAVYYKEFLARSGSSPLIRFILGMFAMIGALVFLGCPWRALLRLSAGDLNAAVGFLGLTAGVFIGVQFLKAGFTLGRSYTYTRLIGIAFPLIMIALVLLAIFSPQLGMIDGQPAGPIFHSTSGPGSQHAPLIISLAAGLVIGILVQRSRFCTVGSVRDVILIRDWHLASGIIAFFLVAVVLNIASGNFSLGFTEQPIAHTDHLWNFLGMALAGLAFILAGGCPGRQLVMAGEGDGDSAIFIIGMVAGAAFAHNMSLASTPAGPAAFGPTAVIVGLVFCCAAGFLLRVTDRGVRS